MERKASYLQLASARGLREGSPPSPPANLFWSRVDRRSPGECWVWTRGRLKAGYGQLTVGGKCRTAHRIAWELTNGPIPDGLSVLHRCDNPPCCNPAHLFL